MLKYLFTAEYADGTVLRQTPEDRSTIEPDKRSAFFDALAREGREEGAKPNNRMVRFTLTGDDGEYSVDLIDGSFTFNGKRVVAIEDSMIGKDLRIIFWRNHSQEITVSRHESTLGNDTIVYRFGWHCTLNGADCSRVMQID